MIRILQPRPRPLLRMTPTPKATLSEIRTALERSLAPVSLEVRDDSARHEGHAGARSGGHYQVAVVSAAFAGRTPLERHRMVYQALEPLMGRGIHAVNIIAHAPQSPGRPAT
ncbi:MAG: BolA family protein [Steroidobacteraceae bacterium]